MSIFTRLDAKSWTLAATIGLLAGSLYFLTAARDLVVGDTGELITVAVSLGVAHPPGYPLFTMLGHLFSLLPLTSIPFRLNLLAVVCNTLAVCIVYFTAARLTTSRIAAFVAALFLAVNPTFWSWSLVAEVFPLNNLLAALLIYLLVRWQQQPDRTRFLIAASFVSGLAMTNHHTIMLLGPAVCFVLWHRRRILFSRPAVIGWCVVVFLLGLLPYLYVPWASSHHPAYNWDNVSSARDLFNLIRRKDFGSGSLISVPGYSGGSGFSRIFALLASLGPLFLLVLPGIIRAGRQRRWHLSFSLIAFAFAGPFFAWISNLNMVTVPSALFVLQRFFLLSQIVIAPLIAFGVLVVADVLARVLPSLKTLALPLVSAMALGAAAWTVATHYRQIDQSDNSIARPFAEDVFATAEPRSVLLVTGDAYVPPLIYLQTVEGAGRDIILITVALLPADWYLQQLREQHPDLQVPEVANLKMLVDANPERKFYVVGLLADRDHSLEETYEPYQHGALLLVQPKSWYNIERLVKENEPLLERYRPPCPDKIRFGTFERSILEFYALPASRFGALYERIGEKAEARFWYEHALAIDPYLLRAREGLARVR
jgi:hypothetical protein